jgi:hypothetical protein
MRQPLQSFLDGELPEAQRVRLSTHLKTCADCADGLRRLEAGDQFVVAARPDPQVLSPAASRALLSRTLAEAAPRCGSPRRGWPLVSWGIATTLLIGTAGAASWFRPWREAGRGSRETSILATIPSRDDLHTIQNASSSPDPVVSSVQIPRSRNPTPKARAGGQGKPAPPQKETRPAPPPVPDLPRPSRARPYLVADTESVLPTPAAVGELADRLEIQWVSADPLATEMAVELALAEGVMGVQALRRPGVQTFSSHSTMHEHEPENEWLACHALASDPMTEQIVEEVLARSFSSEDGWVYDEQTMRLLVAEAPPGFDVNSVLPGEAWPGLPVAVSWPDPWQSVVDPGGHAEIAEPEDGELLVMASEPLPSPVLVSSLPEGAPGFARAAAFRPNGDGELTWTQATASMDADGRQLALVMLGGGVWNW